MRRYVTTFFILAASAASAATGCSGALPQREVPVGNCTQTGDCAESGMVCKEYQCVPCSDHTDCLEGVCDTYGEFGPAGKCTVPEGLMYVHNEAAGCEAGSGTLTDPVCDIPVALTKLARSPKKVLRVMASGSVYFLPRITAATGPVMVLGPGGKSPGRAATLTLNGMEVEEPATVLDFAANTYVVIEGFHLTADKLTAQPGARLVLRRSWVSYMEKGMSFDGASVSLDRFSYDANSGPVLFIRSEVKIANSLFIGNTLEAISEPLLTFNGGSGIFQFNTVAGNLRSMETMSILSCTGASSVVFKNSIFIGNGPAPQIGSACRVIPNSLVVGQTDPVAGQIKLEPIFEDAPGGDYRLKPRSPANKQSVIDKAVEVNVTQGAEPYTDHDYAGSPRPQGDGHDIGAYEASAQ
jgi:hypothetical protein